MPESLSVFINAQKVIVPTGARVRDALAAWNADAAREVDAGTRVVLDNRGLPIDVDTPLHGGAIFRLVSARERARDDGDLFH